MTGDADDQRLGIQRNYLDNADEPARLSDETVAALRSALGEPAPEVAARAPVFVHPGERFPADLGALHGIELADGTQLEVDASAPLDVPLGYHRLVTAAGERRLVVSPGACVLPARRQWGWTAQLYATRSRASWGIGDLGDLSQLTALAREQGAGFVLVNPLHAGGSTSTAIPQEPSPYFPSSRRFFNPLFLAVGHVDGAAAVLGGRLEQLAAEGRALNSDRRIDRDAVWRIKREALREVFDRTLAAGSPDFAAWRRSRGAAVDQFAAWSVLSERYGAGWQSWPDGARRPDGPLVTAVYDEAPGEVAFVAWLQWLAEKQLRAAGQAVKVLQDLPIGVDPQGADAWAYQDALALGVTVGAPPDPFNRGGQNWGLPPFVPWRLRELDYEPFIEAIRATMALAGGLRIDHVMGLFRLWWVPEGMPADQGGYVRYPSSDLLDILALESVRSGAQVVGEDLGTVEPGVRQELARRNVLSYRLLWFEEDPPAQWPAGSLAAVGTHDLPTVAGLWDGSDLADQQASGLDADVAATERLRELLVERAGVAPDASAAQAVVGAYRLLAEAPSLLLAASLDDALSEPIRPNMPGTTERANWSMALSTPLEEFAAHPGVTAVAEQLGLAEASDRVPAAKQKGTTWH
ncbi:MAG: 4-alpha-glucanotransferase [Jatrophihabitans sp.]|uniref:4-alpha-glucanotransferase n=1 Tax=Jatrophihabitans sp. TaxID=1932789 RepID=UPI0039128D80